MTNKSSTKLSILLDGYPAEEAITRKASPIRLCSPWSKRPSLCKQAMVSAMPYIQTCKGKYTQCSPKLRSKQAGHFRFVL